MPVLQLIGQPLTLRDIAAIANGVVRVELAAEAARQMEASRRVVRHAVAQDSPVYGINTGFGKLCEVRIANDAIERLQLNLVRSHACGIGPPLSEPETRALMALRANTLALGYSGVRPLVPQTLLAMLTRSVLAVIPEKGSVGASGDLAPLAHLALAMIGEGSVEYDGETMAAADALTRASLRP